MNEQQYKEFIESQKGMPIKSRVFKHKTQDFYTTQISIMELNNFIEVKN